LPDWPDERTVERLREVVEEEAAAEPDDTETHAAADTEIHRTLAAAAGNRMVQALTDWIFDVVQPLLIEVLQPAVVQSAVVEQHQALLAAVEKGDPARAERAMKDHLLYLQDVLRMVREQSEDSLRAVEGGGGRR
jgi:GntR family transcriptional repressor for pyruvate dehydrogenase complex